MNCRNCNTLTTNPKFCSQSCAATYNGKKFPKRKKEGSCVTCSTPITRRNKYCKPCVDGQQDARDAQTLQEIIYKKHHKSSAFTLVRSRARKQINPKGKSCTHCGYAKHVEVCHIKPIKEFPLDAKVSEVNSITNLILLCPNCHWEFDHPKLD